MTNNDEVRDRFVAAIATGINADAVVEAHFFTPIRQGGTESGVAVIAVHEDAGPPDQIEGENGHHRHAVYTARYRLMLKGSERGKWEFSMQAEADAPLVTIDKVVRGVQRRSGDAEEPQRFNGDEFRSMLPAASS